MVLTLNSWSVTWSARLQTALSVVKLLALALIIVPGMMLLAQGRCCCMAEGRCSMCHGFYQSQVTSVVLTQLAGAFFVHVPGVN